MHQTGVKISKKSDKTSVDNSTNLTPYLTEKGPKSDFKVQTISKLNIFNLNLVCTLSIMAIFYLPVELHNNLYFAATRTGYMNSTKSEYWAPGILDG